eukprot:768173-Hanusia_phi.AAC.1
MNSVRGQLYRLFKPEAGISTPLLSKIDRNPLKSNRLVTEKMKKSRRHSLRRSFTSDMTDEHLLGEQINDWHLRQFELCLHTCEFRYRSKSRDLGDDESRFVPGMKSIGFIQAETEIDKGPTISTVDVDAKTGQRLILYTITVLFSLEDKISTAVGRSWVTYSVVIGHDDHVERDRWYDAILKLIEEKRSMQLAWKLHLIQRNQESDSKHKTWEEARQGKLALTINHKQHKTSRLRNGKVFQDLPGVFKKYAIHRNEWKTAHGVMRIQDVTSALQDLGLNPPDWHAARMLEDLQKTPQRSDCPGFLDLDGFEIIFKSTYDELITSPSDEMMEKLMEIMNRSNNPFLQLLSKEEKENLVEGKDADGRNVCVCRKYLKGTVIVNQGDEGHSMFIIIEGQLSVVVTFGKALSPYCRAGCNAEGSCEAAGGRSDGRDVSGAGQAEERDMCCCIRQGAAGGSDQVSGHQAAGVSSFAVQGVAGHGDQEGHSKHPGRRLCHRLT